MPEYFDAQVWNTEGDVAEALWGATRDEVQDLQDKYDDDPFHTVVFEYRWSSHGDG